MGDGNGNLIQMTKKDMHQKFGLGRIEINPNVDIINWVSFKKISGISFAESTQLEKRGKVKGANPAEWFASFTPIASSDWLSIEKWDGVKWVKI